MYVVGGWHIAGAADAQWHTTAWKMDLAQAKRNWEPIPNAPFARRAVAAIEHQGKLVVIGGMNREGGPTKAVNEFDPKSQAGRRCQSFKVTRLWQASAYRAGVSTESWS